MTDTSTTDAARERQAPELDDRQQRIRRRLERLIGIAATEGNTLTPLRNGDEIFAAMLRAIEAAEHTVDLMTFVYWRGDIARAVRRRALADRARAAYGCGCCSTASAAGSSSGSCWR